MNWTNLLYCEIANFILVCLILNALKELIGLSQLCAALFENKALEQNTQA